MVSAREYTDASFSSRLLRWRNGLELTGVLEADRMAFLLQGT